MVRAEFLLVCDNAFFDAKNKACLIGIFEIVTAGEFPALTPTLAVVARWAEGVARPLPIRFRIVSPENRLIADSGDIVVPPQPATVSYTHIQSFQTVSWPAEGEYAIELYTDGEVSNTAPLVLRWIQ